MEEQSDTPYYLSSCSPYSETAAANPMRAYSKKDCAEIIAHEGGTAYVLAEDYERELATATRERDEARVSVDTLRAAIKTAEAALADIGDSDHEPTDDLAWCERRAQQALPVVRFALAATEAKP
jgi:hypothetical protein